MTLPKFIVYLSLFLFGLIGVIALFKGRQTPETPSSPVETPLEIELDREVEFMPIIPEKPPQETALPAATIASSIEINPSKVKKSTLNLPDDDIIEQLFNTQGPKLPIVETITYTSSVPWLKGRPAWITDYASHYGTSRHFIARSLRGKPDYFSQDVFKGDKFNVLRKDKNFEFYLLVDTSRCRMWFYYIDLDQKKKTLLKTYKVGLGRLDSSKQFGLLTPWGKYTLGSRIIIYKPKMMGVYQGKKTEMITVFGTHWIPFDKEIGPCTLPAKGFGIHGTPWQPGTNGILVDNPSSIGKYEGDGCIRLASPDIEEIYAIVITKPTTIEIVGDFHESSFNDKQ